MKQHAKARAVRDGVPYMLHGWKPRIPALCPVLGVPLQVGGSGGNEYSPSLDRLVPALGYTPENVRVISKRANRLKQDATLDELRRLVAYLERELGGEHGADGS